MSPAPDDGPDKRLTDPLVDLAGEVHELADMQTRMERQIADLAREIDVIVRDPDPDDEEDAGGYLTQLRVQLAEMAAALEALAGREHLIRVPCWVDLKAEEALKIWQDLQEWIHTILFDRYDGRRYWFSCWYLHTELVEELTWLWKTWEYAYRNPKATPGLAGEWHTRWWPHVQGRLKEDGRNCQSREHKVPFRTDVEFSDDGFAAHVSADIAARPRAAKPQPPP